MNTKKFIKKINKLPEYRCELDDENNERFFIIDQGTKLLCIDTDSNELNFVYDDEYSLSFETNYPRDKELLRLLNKYAHSPIWDRPKTKWFKK